MYPMYQQQPMMAPMMGQPMMMGQQPMMGGMMQPQYGMMPQQQMMQPQYQAGVGPGQALRYDPGFVSNVVNVINMSMAQRGFPQPVQNMIQSNLNFQAGIPTIIDNVNRMMDRVTTRLKELGCPLDGSPVRQEMITQAVAPWLDSSYQICSTKLGAMMGQQQMMQPMMGGMMQPQFGQPGIQAQPYGFQQPQFQNVTSSQDTAMPSSPGGLYDVGRKAPNNPVTNGVQPQVAQTTYQQPQTMMPQAQPAHPTYTTFEQQQHAVQAPGAPAVNAAPNVVNSPTFKFMTQGDLEATNSLHDAGITLVNGSVERAEVAPGVTAQASHLEARLPANSDLEKALEIGPQLGDLMEGEYLHLVKYKRIRAIPIATELFEDIRERFLTEAKQDWNHLLKVMKDTPMGTANLFGDFIAGLVNDGLRTRLRTDEDISDLLRIDHIYDVDEIREGKFGGKLKIAPNWEERLISILQHVIDVVFAENNYVKPTDTNLSDVVRCEEVTTVVNDHDRHDLGFLEGDELEELKGHIFQQFSIIRVSRVFVVTNTLTANDLNVIDMVPNHNTPGETLFWTMLDNMVVRHKKSIDSVLFFDGPADSKFNLLEARERVFSLQRRDHYLP